VGGEDGGDVALEIDREKIKAQKTKCEDDPGNGAMVSEEHGRS
jgi:hypothetical protein